VRIAQISDVHVGGNRYRQELLRTAIDEINAEAPDLVVIAGDITDDGYPDQYPLARQELARIECERIVTVPGNHDARNVGYLRYEDTFGARDSRLRLDVGGTNLALVAVDSSKPDLDEGEIGREHYGWVQEGFAGEADLRNQVLDAGDVLSLLRQAGVDLVLAGHRHVPYVWPVGGMLLVHSGTVSTQRTRGFPHPAYNLIAIEQGRISIELRDPGGQRQSLGEFPRDWPEEISARHSDPFVRAQREFTLDD
jgi:3',5'-cyclic AMP phosphodiesterase CpdA